LDGMNDQTRIGNKKEPITMIQIGQKVDDLIDDFRSSRGFNIRAVWE